MQNSGVKNQKVIIAGGGLSGGLIALWLKHLGHESFVLIERSATIGGHHTWSFHEGDLTPETFALIKPSIYAFSDAQNVMFPDLERTIRRKYYTVRSSLFHRLVTSSLSPEQMLFQQDIKQVNAKNLTLADGTKISGDIVIDARNTHANFSFDNPVGYQKFLGLEFTLQKEHGLRTAIIMDAKVPQTDGYRFFYVLPTSANQIFIEDTHYSMNPDIDESYYRREVENYCLNHFGNFQSTVFFEKAALAIPLKVQKNQSKLSTQDGPLRVGVDTGFSHPTTGYSFPIAALVAQQIAKDLQNASPNISKLRTLWSRQSGFYTMLNRMLFGACQPQDRYKIFQKFYGLPEDVIHRFYAGKTSAQDKVRILSGKPPVPPLQAFRSLASDSWMDKLQI